MRIVARIESVNEFVPLSSNRILVNEDGVYVKVVSDGSSGVLLTYKEKLSNLASHDGKIFWVNHTGENVISFFGIIDTEVTESRMFITKTIRDGFIYCSELGEGRKYDMAGNQIWRIDEKFLTFHLHEKILFYQRQHRQVIALDDEEGEIVWQYTLPSEYVWTNSSGEILQPRITSFIGVYNGILWVSLNGGRLLGLQVSTGEELHFVGSSHEPPSHWNNEEKQARSVFGPNSQVDEKEGKVFGLFNEWYGELDLNTTSPLYTIYDCTDSFRGQAIENTLFGGWQGSEICFAQQGWDKDPSFVGLFDRHSKKVTWTSREIGQEGTFRGLSKVGYLGNRLYALDREKVLHVMEKDSNH